MGIFLQSNDEGALTALPSKHYSGCDKNGQKKLGKTLGKFYDLAKPMCTA